jgi:hypothetical protein
MVAREMSEERVQQECGCLKTEGDSKGFAIESPATKSAYFGNNR